MLYLNINEAIFDRKNNKYKLSTNATNKLKD